MYGFLGLDTKDHTLFKSNMFYEREKTRSKNRKRISVTHTYTKHFPIAQGVCGTVIRK